MKLSPVDHDPFEAEESNVKITPVDYDPFAGAESPEAKLTPVDYDPFDPSTAKPVEQGFLDKARETVGDIQQGSIETAISLGKRVESAKGSFVQSAGRMFTSTGRDMAIQQSQRATNTEKVIDAIDRGEIDPQDWFGQAQEKFDLSANDFDSRAVNRYAKGDEQARTEIRQDLEQIPKDPRESKTFEVANQVDQFVAEKFKSDPEFREEFVSGKIPDALGSFFGFAIPTLLTRGSTTATLGVTAGLGSSVNSAAQFEDAVKSGASLDEAFEAADIAGIVGTSEAVPIVSILNRIDKSTGGSIKKALLSAAKGGFEEGAQEAFQQTMSNVIASDLVEYDPDRNAFQGTGENAGLGFTVGGLVSFLGSLIGGRRGSSAPDYLDDAPAARDRPQEPGASQPPAQEPVTQSARRPEPSPLDEMAEIVNASDAELNQMLDEYLAADAAPANEGVTTVRQGEFRPVPDTTGSQDGGKTASVPVMITQRMRAELRDMGYADEDIRAMRPQEANDILAQRAPSQADAEAAEAQPAKPEQDRRTDPERPDRGERRRLQTPKDFLEQRHREKVEQFGLTPEQAEAFAPQVDTDPTTGYFQKRDLEPTIERARQHVEETGEPGIYVETDISNMGGGNAKLGTRQFDEQFYTPAANIMREELEGTGADVIPVRKGGDENGFIVVNGAPEVVEQAMRSAQARIAELAQETGLSDVPHTKEEARAAGLRGVGLYYGLSNIRPGDSVSQILSDADTLVEARKKEQPDVNRSATQTPQAESPAAGRAGQGTGAPSRGGPQGRAGAFDPATARPVEQEPQAPADAGVSRSGETSFEEAPPGLDSGPLTNFDNGAPGVNIEKKGVGEGRNVSVVLRDEAGEPAGVLSFPATQKGQVDPQSREGAIVFVRPDKRRQGIATQLYDAAAEAGYDVDAISGTRHLTDEGRAFVGARQSRQATTQPAPPREGRRRSETQPQEARDAETQEAAETTEVLTPQTFDSRRPGASSAEGAPQTQDQTQSSRPGTQYAPLVEQSGNLPVESATEVVMADGRRVPIPEEPIRRRDIVKRLEKAFGVRVYQGKVKGKSRLGFYRTGVGEIRTKNKDHLEVTGHELAHWLDDRFTWIGNLYRSKPFKNEIKSVSYDESKIHEGYAEFMRLFFTDEAQAMDKAPKFYQAFTDKLKGTTLEAPIKDIQGMMHAWYRQGSLQRARSKIGESPAGAMDKIKEFRDWLTGEHKDQFFDDRAHIAKVEKTLNGRIGGSFSPYWSSRILQRVGAIADAVIHHGTIGYNRNDGSHYFTGESLDAAVLSKIEGREREYAEYAIGRRARELKQQKRENNFTDDEIEALLNHANEHTDFPKIFQAQQAFNKRMVDFLIESGVISKDKAEKMMEINQNYVSFKRVIDSFGKHGAISKQANPFMRLKGGTANVRNMFETMQENIETFIHLGVLNQFKTQFYQMIDTSQDSAMFATKIGKDVKPVQLNKSELASRLNKILGENWQDSGIQIDEEMLSDLVLFTGVDPKGDVDFYYKNGEKVFYEIGDGSLYKELTNLAGEKMGLTFKVWDTVFGKPKRLLTATATAFNPKFQIRNFLMRDLANRVYFTRAEKSNPVRIAGQAFKGLAESFGKSDAYWLARANGLGMESTYVGSQYAHTKKASIAPAFNWWQKATLGKDKAIDELIEFVGHPEMANRLAEYKQLTAEGKTSREGAIGGIDVSVDFRRRGRHELIRYIANGSAFFNPRIQGLYKIGEELTNLDPDARDGYIRRRAAVVAARALWTTTLPAMALWYFNHDDERYQNLPDDVRDQNFVVYYGTGEDDYFLVAKSFEMGSMFASTPERVLDAVAEKDGRELAESMSLMAAETLSLDPRPSLWQVEQEITQNKTWTGAPIIPNWLNDKEMEKARYFDDRTSQTARWLGEKLDVRPDHLEHRFRGYTSMIGDLTLTMTDYWLRQENQVDPEMTYQDYVSKYVGLLPRSGEPYRTEAQKDFYELATEADKVFNTFNDMIARPGEYETLNERLQEYLNPDERKVYFSTQEAFNNARGIITELNNTADAIRQATDMSAEEKREQMEEIKKGKNQVYEQITKEFSPEQIEELEKQLSDPGDE